jgi:hypothetical protein
MKLRPGALLVQSVAFEIVLILGALFYYQWGASQRASGYLLFFVLTCLLWPLSFLVSLIYWPAKAKKLGRAAAHPFLIHVATALVLFTAVYFDPSSHLELLQKIRGFETVVQMVKRGQLRPDASGTAKLPARLQYLSQNSSSPRPIWIERRRDVTRVMFYTTTRDGLMSFDESGYVYCSDGKPPRDGAFQTLRYSGLNVQKIDSRLYFVTIHSYESI